MKKIYFILIASLITATLTAQTFTEITGTPFDGITSPIAVADFDHDNDLDAFMGASLYTNDGNGLFELKTAYGYEGVTSIAFSNVDGDSDQDIMISRYKNTTTYEPDMSFHTTLRKYNENGSYYGITNNEFVQCAFGSVNFADVDNDNDQDVLITGYTFYEYWLWGLGVVNPQTNLYLNDGTGVYSLATGNSFEDVGASSAAFADVDNDNDLDLLIIGNSGYSYGYHNDPVAKLYLNDGNGIFVQDSMNDFVGVFEGTVAFADIDNDNDQDVIITGIEYHGGEYLTKLYTNNGSGIFTEANYASFDGTSHGIIAIADIDNDNDQDLLLGNRLYINDGNGNFSSALETPFNVESPTSVAFADIDNDNDPDVLISGEGGAKLYENNALSTEILELQSLFNKVSIYPNPSQGPITLNMGELTRCSVNIYSSSGQLVYHQDNVTGPTHQLDLNTQAGMYFLELKTQNKVQRYPIIKQ